MKVSFIDFHDGPRKYITGTKESLLQVNIDDAENKIHFK